MICFLEHSQWAWRLPGAPAALRETGLFYRYVIMSYVLSVSRRSNNSSFQPFVIVIIELVLATIVATLGLSAKFPTCVFAAFMK